MKNSKPKIIIKTLEQIEGIRKSSVLAASTLKTVGEFVKAGVSTKYLNDICNQYIRDNKGIPAPLGYRGFPSETCISVNDVVCHGLPGKYELRDGDIVNIDVTTILEGYYGDTSTMFTIGNVSEYAKKLISVTKECLAVAINQCYEGNNVNLIGKEITKLAKENNFSVVYEFCGHGVGLKFHEEPEISHNETQEKGPDLLAGMTFTIEPMINAGKARCKIDKQDKWTARTIDGKLSAQFEHTICVTKTIPFVMSDIVNEWAIPKNIF